MRLTLSTDLDGVCFDMVGNIINFCRDRYDLILRREQCIDYSIPKFIDQADGPKPDIERAKRAVLHAIRFDADFYWNCPVLPGAKRAINELAKHFNIIAITSRPIVTRKVTRTAVARDFPLIQFVHHTKQRSKSIRAREKGVVLHLEDHPETVESFLDKRIQVYYIRHSYGRSIECTRGRWRLYEAPDALTASRMILESMSMKEASRV